MIALFIDSCLGLTMIWLAYQALHSRRRYDGVVLFVAYGLLLAVAWARLGAPDVAMAEAAVGAGITGALLMSSLTRLTDEAPGHATRPALSRRASRLTGILLMATLAPLAAVLLDLPGSPGLAENVEASMKDSGVSHPVTAVLLNFRGYDTLLEMVVLLLVIVAVRSSVPRPTLPARSGAGRVLSQLTGWLSPFLIVVAGYLLWVGSSAPGGAFQAGATLAGVGVLLIMASPERIPRVGPVLLGSSLIAGALAFIVVALLGLVVEGHLLRYPPRWASALILTIEAVATLSIAATLIALYAALYRPWRSGPP